MSAAISVGVAEQARPDRFLLARLGLELRHAAQPAHRRHAGEDPAELDVPRDHRLHEDRGALRVDAGGEIQGAHLLDALRELFGILVERDRVLVDDAEDRLVVVLNPGPVAQRSKVVADVQRSGRLHAGEDSWFAARHGRDKPLILPGSARCPESRDVGPQDALTPHPPADCGAPRAPKLLRYSSLRCRPPGRANGSRAVRRRSPAGLAGRLWTSISSIRFWRSCG